jgi:hypothetical protein
MAFQVSPGVNVSEIDLTSVVPAVSTTEAAISGPFKWGPVDQRVLVSSEDDLVQRFGKPSNTNFETFYTAANFLSYGNKLYVVRASRTANTDTVTYSNTDVVITLTANSSSNGSVALTTNTAGVGYLTAPTVTVSGPDTGSNTATITASVSGVNGGLTLTLTSAGSGYATNPTVTFSKGADGYNVYGTQKAQNACYPANTKGILIKNEDDYDNQYPNGKSGTQWVARFPGDLGNSLAVSTCDSANAFSLALTGTIAVANGGALVTGTTTAFNTEVTPGDQIFNGTQLIGTAGSVTNATSITLLSAYKGQTLTGTSVTRKWLFASSVSGAPGTSAQATALGASTDQMHVVVYDEDGAWTGTRGTVLEVFDKVSKASDAVNPDGTNNYYKNAINNRSQYIWWLDHEAGSNKGTVIANGKVYGGNQTAIYRQLSTGSDGGPTATTVTESNIIGLNDLTTANRGYRLFSSAEDVDVSLILQGKARGGTNGEGLANDIIDNIADVRKDCVVFVSPDQADVVNNAGSERDDVIAFRNSLTSTSYAVLDSGYKYQYDKYNDVYRYIPLNGDIAGTCVRTDLERDAWFSPAGFSRGGIKNIVKLAYNPNKADRDQLYQADVNPVNTFPGQGTLLFGDKTLLGQPSAFDRINVRRLFIVLEKAISTAAKFSLFEFNDEFTRAQFKNLVEPFLRDVQGRRGIYDFKVVCDGTNNTGEVIDRNEFIGDIYVKPARSINYIQLNFVAVRTGVEFSEVVGQF